MYRNERQEQRKGRRHEILSSMCLTRVTVCACVRVQIQVSYYSPGQYPSSGQQYRVPQPMSHQVSYPAQRAQPIPQPTQQSGECAVAPPPGRISEDIFIR